MIESFAVPLPGETALIAFGVLASQGHYNIAAVIAVAAAGAIVGDNLGYLLIGRRGGGAFFNRGGWLRKYPESVLPGSEELMAKHGGKTVFFGRFITVLRYTAAWIAGIGRMRWWKFLFWNAAGGICWATLAGLVSYYGGKAAGDAIKKSGLLVGAGLAVLLVVGFLGGHYRKRWLERRLLHALQDSAWSRG